jgi:type 1 glutamine amidotransferase
MAQGCTVDPAVGAVYGFTVDQSLKPKGYVIPIVHARSNGAGRMHAAGGGDVAGNRGGAATRGGASPAQALG